MKKNKPNEVSLKDRVLGLLKLQPQQHFNARQLAHHLELRSADYKNLRSELKNLTREGRIVMHPDSRYSFRDRNKILKGTISIHPDGYGFFTPESVKKNDVFIPARFKNYCMNGDTVLVESFQNERDGRYEGRVVQIVERARDVIVGRIFKSGAHYYADPMDKGGDFEVYIPKKHLNKATNTELVSVKLTQYPGPGIMCMGEVIKVFGDVDSQKDLTDAVLQTHRIKRGFSKEIHAQLKSLPGEDSIAAGGKRVDLTAVPLITIDGITARDFDDAVCVLKRGRSYILYVCIADVAEYVNKGGVLDQEAYRRGTSTYFPDECVPMLPERLSTGLCSLNPFKPRYTLTAELHFNDKFEWTQARFYRSLMKSCKRATYKEVQAYFDSTGDASCDAPVKKSLNGMKALAENMMRQADRRGALGFDLPESEVVYDAQGKIQAVQRAQRFFSHRLIEVFMVAANQAVARWFSIHGIPLLYRVHDRPDEFKILNFTAMASNMGFKQQLHESTPGTFFQRIEGNVMSEYLKVVFLRSLKQALYTPENRGHYGLGLDDYAHFTSPIRRYPDLIVHRQLKGMLDKSPDGVLTMKKADIQRRKKALQAKPVYSFMDLKQIGDQSSKKERESVEAEREVLACCKAVFVKDFIHDKFFGLIKKITKKGLIVELEPHYIEGFLAVADISDDYFIFDEKRVRLTGRRTRKTLKMGDRVWVTVAEVNVLKGEIVLAMAETKKKKTGLKQYGRMKGRVRRKK